MEHLQWYMGLQWITWVIWIINHFQWSVAFVPFHRWQVITVLCFLLLGLAYFWKNRWPGEWNVAGKIPEVNMMVWLVVTGTMEFWLTFPSYWECRNPNWRTHIFRVGIPPTRWSIAAKILEVWLVDFQLQRFFWAIWRQILVMVRRNWGRYNVKSGWTPG